MMPTLTQLRIAAREIFAEALKAADPYRAVKRALQLSGDRLSIDNTILNLQPGRPIYSIAIGKAAMPMAIAIEEILGERLAAGVISTSDHYRTAGGSQRVSEGLPTSESNRTVGASRRVTQVNGLRQRIFNGGHPEPNDESLEAAAGCFELLERANKEKAVVMFSVSGGGSAMLESPALEEITLADLRAANKSLVTSGASISEINTVRRAFSAVKGGRLAARAQNCDQITLIVSDVSKGQEHNVASGPTLSPPEDGLCAKDIVARYELRSSLPESILSAVDNEHRPPKLEDYASENFCKPVVLLDNKTAIDGATQAARERHVRVELATDISDGPIEAGCFELMERLSNLDRTVSSGACLISGGEFSCPVRGPGAGGRNLETALRLALEWEERNQRVEQRPFTALCAGTDGIDGNSPAAGAIVDHTTISRARAIGLNAEEFLMRSDSYSFFVALGDAITTGATGTNVRDLRILLTGEN